MQRVASVYDIPLGKTLCVTIDEREVLIGHTSEGFFAVDNLCTHAEARLSDGKLKGCQIFCPLHAASFDLRNGKALSKPARIDLKTYPLTIEGEDILVST